LFLFAASEGSLAVWNIPEHAKVSTLQKMLSQKEQKWHTQALQKLKPELQGVLKDETNDCHSSTSTWSRPGRRLPENTNHPPASDDRDARDLGSRQRDGSWLPLAFSDVGGRTTTCIVITQPGSSPTGTLDSASVLVFSNIFPAFISFMSLTDLGPFSFPASTPTSKKWITSSSR
jgi:hypothetical protein